MSIEALRGIAALAVLLFHANLHLARPNYFGVQAFGDLLQFGRAGVDVFFVLSGFVMVHVHARDFGRPGRTSWFLMRRFVRIYPIYWAVLVPLILFSFIAPSIGAAYAGTADQIVRSLLLIPQGRFPLLDVAWTLEFEMLFYLMFAVVILHPAIGLAAMVAWQVAVAIVFVGGIELAFPGSFLFSHHALEFGAGMVAGGLARHAPVSRACAVLAAGTAVLAIAAVIDVALASAGAGTVFRTRCIGLAYGLAAAAIIAALASADIAARPRVPRAMALLGAASYAIYLAHLPILSLVGKVVARAGGTALLQIELIFALGVAAAIGGGIAVHLLLERPLLAALNGALRRRAEARVARREERRAS